MSKEFDNIVEDIRSEARQDYVGLWEVCIKVRSRLHPDGPTGLKDLVLAIVRRLLSDGLQAVTLIPPGSGCVPWASQDPAHVIGRIEAEWDALGREPSVGDIVWFNDPKWQGVSDR
jgi:hypothetical protein